MDIDYAVSVSLEKPLGLVLEEKEDGVYVKEILETGSAFECEDISEGQRILEVESLDCSELGFDDVMGAIGDAASPVSLSLESTVCLAKLVDPKSGVTFASLERGENLRRALLANSANVYDFKGTLTNCNGAGQCGTCVVAVDDAPDFAPRSGWESDKLEGRPETHRLACQTLVAGERATITLRPTK
ncbi:hypothetical protein CTAYLR_008783 [Chrysophaeum taylorii]|uniref:PDZ domain-containing protein n=1 Tax=Chrysophaeum taylorii TaxID=2483200 RepID=A0AAD7UPB7_9STRA|nr:hypothetical protein CTAYLR_008783 [Chrysophaeum taylorii]